MTKVVQGLELAPLAPGTAAPGECLGERMDLVEHLKVQLTVTLGSAQMDVGRLFAISCNWVSDMALDVTASVRIG